MTAAADPGTAAQAELDRILATARVVVMAGSGGVGKTTVAAALGLRAAQRHGRRAIVVTVDPARRLAEALGVARLTEEPVLVPVGQGRGRLWVLMVDMAKSWDRLVAASAPAGGGRKDNVTERLMANRLYRTLTRRFVQSHDYIALDHLVTLTNTERYDLVIVDTPPSRHALDLLDAPGRMIEFFESRLLRWLTATSGLTGVAAKPFLAVATRLLGTDFLAQISEFFTLFAKLRPGFVARARAVEQRLGEDTTSFVVVTTTDPVAAEGTQDLVDELERRQLSPGLFVVNRLAPTLKLADGELRHTIEPDDLDQLEDPELRAAVGQLIDQAAVARLPSPASPRPMVGVPWSAADLTDLEQLAALFELDRP